MIHLNTDTLQFLNELAMNNNREWFNAHKERYLAVKADFDAFTQGLIDEMVKYDDSLAGCTAKNSVYRIYRDTRFSSDKTPYKTHLACFLASHARKNCGVPGYYFQVGEAYGLEGPMNLGGGIFMPDSPTLNAIRQEIFYCPDEFEKIISEKSYKKYFGSEFFTIKKLTRVPKGYPADWEHADWLKYKDYTTAHILRSVPVDSEKLFAEVIKIWKASVPLNLFIQRAIEDVGSQG